MDEQRIRIAAKLYECRDAARFILRENYAATITPWRGVIAEHMALDRLSVLQAALRLCQNASGDTATVSMLVMAAALDMIEQPLAADASDPHVGSTGNPSQRD